MSMCTSWLKAVRMTASHTTVERFRGSAVLGDRHSGFVVELRDGQQIDVGRQCCRYCAKADAMMTSAAAQPREDS
jgi:hypothetical protein